MIIGHLSWTQRKIDPRFLDLNKLRRDVAVELKLGPPGLRKPITTPPAVVPAGEDNDMARLVTYGGKVYLVSGLMRRYVPWTKDQQLLKDLTKAYGPARAISRDEMGLYTPLDTVLAIQGGVAKNVGLALTGQAAIAADLDSIQDDLADDPENASA